MTDSSKPNSTEIDTLWLSDKDYNYINAEFTAMYTPQTKYELPDYIGKYSFGIIEGKMQLTLSKINRNGISIHYNCIKNLPFSVYKYEPEILLPL